MVKFVLSQKTHFYDFNLFEKNDNIVNSYSFNCGSNATVTEKSGGMSVTAGPVTLTP